MKISDLQKLHQKKYRKEFDSFLVEGPHLIEELEQSPFEDCILYVTDNFLKYKSRFPKEIISEQQFKRISDVKTPQGIIAHVPLHNLTRLKRKRKVIYLDQIQDPGNLGTLIRTAAWFNQFSFCLSHNCVDPFNSKVIRASMGSIFHVKVETDCDYKMLKDNFKQIACLDIKGESIESEFFCDFDCFVIGNEANGLSESIRSIANISFFSIKGNSLTDSLNAAIAGSIIMYETNKKAAK